MVDPTLWSQARLPSTEHKGIESIQQAGLRGQQSRLYEMSIQSKQNEKKQLEQLEALQQQAIESWNIGDRNAMMTRISEMARYSPEAAKAFKDTFQDLDKTNGMLGAMHLYNAVAVGSEDTPVSKEARRTSIAKAIDAFSLGPSNPLLARLLEAQDEKDPVKQTAKLNLLIQAAKELGLFPGGSEDDLARRRVEVAEGQLALGQEKFAQEKIKDLRAYQNQLIDNYRQQEKMEQEQAWKLEEAGQFDTADKKLYNEMSTERRKLGAEIVKFDALARQFEAFSKNKKNVRGGWERWVAEKGKSLFGIEDENSSLFKGWQRIKNSEVVSGLPPGVASDRDIQVFSKGFYGDYANPDALAQFLRGALKIKRIEDVYHKAKMGYMENNISPQGTNMGIRGFDNYWDANADRLIANAGINLDVPGQQASPAQGQQAPAPPADMPTRGQITQPEIDRVEQAAKAQGVPEDVIYKNEKGQWGYDDIKGNFVPLNLR